MNRVCIYFDDVGGLTGRDHREWRLTSVDLKIGTPGNVV